MGMVPQNMIMVPQKMIVVPHNMIMVLQNMIMVCLVWAYPARDVSPLGFVWLWGLACFGCVFVVVSAFLEGMAPS